LKKYLFGYLAVTAKKASSSAGCAGGLKA